MKTEVKTMAEMTRVEAAAVLDAMIFGTYPDDDITIEKIEIEAVRFAIAALREQGQGYTMTADRLPDGSKIVAQPDPATGLKGCWHCINIEAHHIEYVIAVKAKGGTPMNMPVDCPYHYCPACGRKLEVEE